MESKLPIIDTHFHVWDANKYTMPWLKNFSDTLKRVYTLDDYQNAIADLNFVKSCYEEVDVAKEEQGREADFAIQLCEDPSNSVVAATIGCDLSHDSFEAYIKHYSKKKFVKAVRHNFFASDPVLCASKTVIKNTRLLGDLDVMSDLVMDPNKIQYGVDLVAACPDTRFVVDHCGLIAPDADASSKEKWHEGMLRYADANNTICKISEFCFLAKNSQWKVEEAVRIIEHCISCFGEYRIVFATNWPVSEINSSVTRWLEMLQAVLQAYPESLSRKLFYQNAQKFYGL